MYKIKYSNDSQTIHLTGKMDSSAIAETKEVFDKIEEDVTIDMSNLDFICSAGLGIMVMTYTRLNGVGKNISLSNLNDHLKKVFKVSLLDTVFEIT